MLHCVGYFLCGFRIQRSHPSVPSIFGMTTSPFISDDGMQLRVVCDRKESINNLLNEIFGSVASQPQRVTDVSCNCLQVIFSQLPSVPDPGTSIRALPKQRPALPPPPPTKRRKLILPDPEYVPSSDPTTTVSEVESLFETDDKPAAVPANAHPAPSDLIPTHSKLPPLYWKMIPYEFFNRVQSATVDTLLSSDANVVVSAPTVVSFSVYHTGLRKDCAPGARGHPSPRRVAALRPLPRRPLSLPRSLRVSHEGTLPRSLHQLERQVPPLQSPLRGRPPPEKSPQEITGDSDPAGLRSRLGRSPRRGAAAARAGRRPLHHPREARDPLAPLERSARGRRARRPHPSAADRRDPPAQRAARRQHRDRRLAPAQCRLLAPPT